MVDYVYRGPQPAEDDDGGLVHPGDIRDFAEEPDCPPWELVPGGERQSAAGAAPVIAGAGDGQPSLPPPPPVTTPAALAAKQEGM